jgi:hypothetical protein
MELNPNIACKYSLLDDADYVLREIARGEILGASPPPATLEAIAELAAAVSACRAAPAHDDTALETALGKVMTAIWPVSVQTLRDTDGLARHQPIGRIGRWLAEVYTGWPLGARSAEAYRFSGLFFWLTTANVAAALICSYWAANPNTLFGKLFGWDVRAFGVMMEPFTYGAMGACVFLLRSLHRHIYGRTFDRRRKPEYFNRILLGAISGGAVVLLVHSNPNDTTATKVSATALGFLAGYNTDLLFSAIERITNAIFPKAPDPPPAK